MTLLYKSPVDWVGLSPYTGTAARRPGDPVIEVHPFSLAGFQNLTRWPEPCQPCSKSLLTDISVQWPGVLVTLSLKVPRLLSGLSPYVGTVARCPGDPVVSVSFVD